MSQTSASPAAATSPPGAAPPRRQGYSGYIWVVLFASLLVQTTASFGNQAISPLAPFLLADLGLSRTEIGLVVTAFTLGAVLMLTPAGWISDRLGVRRMFLGGLLLVGAPLLVAAQSPSLALLLAPMVISGIGNAIALPPTTRAIIYWFPPRLRGTAMGIKQTGVALAGALMGLSVPRLAEALGWRGALSAIGWITLVAGLLVWVLYREHPES